MLSASVVADIDRQVNAVRKHFSTHFPTFAEDIQQEAWKAALEAAPRYCASTPGAKGYFYRVAACAVAPAISRWLAVTSLPRAAARAGEGGKQYRLIAGVNPKSVNPDNADASVARRISNHSMGQRIFSKAQGYYEPVDTAPAPDLGLHLRDAQRQLARLRLRWRRAVEAAAKKLADDVRQIGYLAIGLDAPPRSPGDIARDLGVDVEDIARAIRTFNRATKRHPLVVSLVEEINHIEENLP